MGVFNFKEFVFRSNKVLPTEYDDALSYYEVLGKVATRLNDVTNAANALADSLVKPYSDTTSYLPGNYVWYNNLLWKCTNSNYGGFNINDWGGEPIIFTEAVGDDIITFKALVNTIVENQQSLIERTIAGIATPYDSNHNYEVGDYVSYRTVEGAIIYKCIANTTGTFDSDKWVAVVAFNELFDYVVNVWTAFFDEYSREWGLANNLGSSPALAMTQKFITDGFVNTPNNLLNLADAEMLDGFYNYNGTLNNSPEYKHTFIECQANETLYTNLEVSQLAITYFDENKTYISGSLYSTHDVIKVPDNQNIKYLSIPLRIGIMGSYLISNTPVTSSTFKGAYSSIAGWSDADRYKLIKLNTFGETNITIQNKQGLTRITKNVSTKDSLWKAIEFNITNATFYGASTSILLARKNDIVVFLSPAQSTIYRAKIGTGGGIFDTIATIPNLFSNTSRFGVRLNVDVNVVTTFTNIDDNIQTSINLLDLIGEGYKAALGLVYVNTPSYSSRAVQYYIKNDYIIHEPIELQSNHWNGKIWYAYGTSITNIAREGKYPLYLRDFSGLTLINKGISGGGIGDLGAYSEGQVYDAICNVSDGKTQADLITLETGANDTNANVPLGTIYDTGRETLSGCLNDCLRYLQANTNAQIAVFHSPPTTTMPNAASKYYEWAKMIEEICDLNYVPFIKASCNLGYGKITSQSGSLYVVDNIHQTNLGGYLYADTIWATLKNIPIFRTSI